MREAPAPLHEAEELLAAGHLAAASTLLQAYCARHPSDAQAWFLLGACRHQSGALQPALEAFAQAQILDAGHPQLASAEVAVLSQMGRHKAALSSGTDWLALHPDDAAMHFNLGLVCQAMHEQAGALAHYEQALALDPANADALQNRAIALSALGRINEAVESNLRLTALRPQSAEAHHNLAESLLAAGRHEEVVTAAGRVLALAPGHAAARLNRGYALAALGRFEESRADLAEALDGDDGSLRRRFSNWAASAGFADTRDMRDLRVLLQAEDLYLLAGYARHEKCDWDDAGVFNLRCAQLIDTAPPGALQSRSLAFKLLNLPLPAAAQKKLADRVALGITRASAALPGLQRAPRPAREKLRIGYLSSDFGLHPTSRLTRQIYGLHDRRRFEVYGYALSADDGSAGFAAIRRGCDQFMHVNALEHAAIAGRIAADGIDILVDLNGYNRDGRSEVFALRPAPVQVGYAAYPATLGGTLLDYVIADHSVIPQGSEHFYAEHVVRLPDCYLPNSLRHAGLGPAPSRQASGLPAQGIVFCALHRHEKIDPTVFVLWMRILARTPAGVLWLQAGPGEANLRRHATAAGIDQQRLVFAPVIETGAYLARLQLADVYLDTLHWTTHTQGVDALWAGVPIITRPGEHWVSRLAAGLLHAVGLEDCIVNDLETYEALACELAANPHKLQALKARLARNRDTHPLFDTEQLVQHLDAAYLEMWRIHASGEAPRSFDVIKTPRP